MNFVDWKFISIILCITFRPTLPQVCFSKDSGNVVGLMTELSVGQPRFDFRQGSWISLLSIASRLHLGPTQLPLQWVPSISVGVNPSWCQPDHSLHRVLHQDRMELKFCFYWAYTERTSHFLPACVSQHVASLVTAVNQKTLSTSY